MESMKIVRGQVSSIVDIDFFLNEADLNAKYEDERIARVIKGSVYERTRQRINDFIARCDQTLAGLQDRVNQTESEYSSLVSRARSEEPGSGPSEFWVDNKDPNSVAKYNAKVSRHNAQIDLHRRIVDQANRAKERYEDAVEKFNDKKSDLEEQTREKLEELKPALDQDILTLMGKMQQLAYDNTRNKSKFFEGFLLSYLAKKAYVFLYDHIDNTTQQRAATDIFKKLDDEIDLIMSSNPAAVQDGLLRAGHFLSDCHQTNVALQKNISENLERLPYQLCSETVEEVRQLLSLSSEVRFDYEHIIDPDELAKVENKVRARKDEFGRNIKKIDDFAARFDPTFGEISSIKDFAEAEFAKMRETKTSVFDPVSKDIFFAFGIFDDEEQEQYMKKHKQWLQTVQQEIEKSLSIDLSNLVRTIIETELLTKTTKQMLDSDLALIFFSNKQKISQQKQQFIGGIRNLDSILHKINELPKENSEKFTKKMALLLNLSLIPLGNLGVLFPIYTMIKEYLPAFVSSNESYVALREEHIKKFEIYSYIHAGLALAFVVAAFLIGAETSQIVLLLVGFTYIVSTIAIFLKSSQLKKI
jgi:hypothetical protein